MREQDRDGWPVHDFARSSCMVIHCHVNKINKLTYTHMPGKRKSKSGVLDMAMGTETSSMSIGKDSAFFSKTESCSATAATPDPESRRSSKASKILHEQASVDARRGDTAMMSPPTTTSTDPPLPAPFQQLSSANPVLPAAGNRRSGIALPASSTGSNRVSGSQVHSQEPMLIAGDLDGQLIQMYDTLERSIRTAMATIYKRTCGGSVATLPPLPKGPALERLLGTEYTKWVERDHRLRLFVVKLSLIHI